MKKKSTYPPGWDEARVRRVLAHYEQQTEAEAVAEDEAAFENQTQTAMEVPVELVPVVRELIAKHQRLKPEGQVRPDQPRGPQGIPRPRRHHHEGSAELLGGLRGSYQRSAFSRKPVTNRPVRGGPMCQPFSCSSRMKKQGGPMALPVYGAWKRTLHGGQCPPYDN